MLHHMLRAAAQRAFTVLDPYFKYVTMLLHGDGSALGSDTVTPFNSDASTNAFNVTINGDARSNNFNPYQAGYYSNYFDGSGDYLSVPSNAVFSFGTGDFTLEAWVFITGGTTRMIFDTRSLDTLNAWGLNISSGNNLDFIYASGTRVTSASTVSTNQWVHVAVSRSGSTIRLFINGTVDANTATYASAIDAQTNPWVGAGRADGSGNPGYYMNGYISNARIVKGTAVYTGNFTPSTTPLTAISGTSLLTCQSNRFIDNSTNAFTITVNGNTSIAPAQPFTLPTSVATYGSGYLDGTGDYLTAPNNTAFDFGSGSFTLEAMIFPLTSTPSATIFGKRASGAVYGPFNFGFAGSLNLGYLTSFDGSNWGVNISSSVACVANAWNHIAVTRNGSTFTIWVNGVSGATASNASALMTNTTAVSIGATAADGTSPFFGYISNARIVKGTAVYTSAFTPPTAPLTAISGTSLLTTQYNGAGNNNGFKDSSQNNFVITRNGNTTQGTFSPYGSNWSNYFDGTSNSNYLSIPRLLDSNVDITLECWINMSAAEPAAGAYIAAQFVSGGADRTLFIVSSNVLALQIGSTFVTGTIPIGIGKWNHVAWVRSGNSTNNWSIYVNGVRDGQMTYTGTYQNTPFTIGATNNLASTQFPGYISNLRLLKGTALYSGSSFTPPTAPLTAITNTVLLTCADNRFIDDSSSPKTITVNGSPSVQRFSPFSPTSAYSTSVIGGSGYFDGSGDYLTSPTSTALGFGTGDFVIESFVYCTSLGATQTINDARTGNTTTAYVFSVFSNGALNFYDGPSNTDRTSTTGVISLNTWNHVLASRSGTTLKLFVNGVVVGTFSSISSDFGSTQPSTVGRQVSGSGQFNGYITDLRILKGTAVTTAFTPPTAPLTAVSNTSLLLNYTNAGILDNAMMNNLETVGNAQISTSVKKYGTGSLAMTASGDYCRGSQPSVVYDINGSDFTIEFWVNFTSLAADRALISKYGNSAETAGGLGYVLQWVQSSSVLRLVLGVGGGSDALYTWSWTPSTSTWYHVAVTRSGTSGRAFINGTQIGTTSTVSTSDVASPNAIQVGKTHTVAQYLLGYMDDVRITKGVARYTANFTPPTAAFPNN